jgi:hypothetical protein
VQRQIVHGFRLEPVHEEVSAIGFATLSPIALATPYEEVSAIGFATLSLITLATPSLITRCLFIKKATPSLIALAIFVVYSLIDFVCGRVASPSPCHHGFGFLASGLGVWGRGLLDGGCGLWVGGRMFTCSFARCIINFVSHQLLGLVFL